ncbi:low affinity iron permease family protein [uncultured Fluviicola sp.]|uniref:low affinity iron permease family protein n=1 Tax=uncultured Fluviicola sp. TaxID=463303 RepID=UPI0025DB1E62|nr:low affinity iron permease family protein [uncultured Fluviicola sp.]
MVRKKSKKQFFENFASKASKAVGSPYAFVTALSLVIVWAICGPFFDFSETWQLVINTGTTIITFLMVFLIQKSQNKDSLAIQLKLNELVASSEKSSNRLVDIESMTEEEMMIVQKYYQKLSELSDKHEPLQTSHSIEEANETHKEKYTSVSKKTTPKKQTASKSSTRNSAPKTSGRGNTKPK